MRKINRIVHKDIALRFLRGCYVPQFIDRVTKLVSDCLDQINEFYDVLSTVEDGKDGKDGEQGPMGPAGPVGPMGPAGSKGNNGIGVPPGGNAGQYLKKKSNSDYDTEWSDVQGGSGSVNSVNGKTGDVVLSAEDVDALPSDTPLFSGDYNDLANQPTIPTVPTNVSAFNNDAGYITTAVNNLVNYYLKSEVYTKNEVENLIRAIQNFHFEIYTSTSDVSSPTSNVLYLIGPTGSGSDKYEEYVYDSTKQEPWVKIGDTSIDLSDYYTKGQTNAAIITALNVALADYTTTAALNLLLSSKQDTLVSGTNIKTINSESILGSGNINIDISGKEDVTTIVVPINTTDATLPITTLVTEVSKYYRIDVPIETLTITLPAMTDLTTVRTVVIYLTAGTTPAVTITSADSKDVYYQDGYEIEAGKTYEVNALFNGSAWIVAAVKINTSNS